MDVDEDDIDQDIQRLKIILESEDDDGQEESDGELRAYENNEDDNYSHLSRPSTSSEVTASSLPTTSICTDADDGGLLRFDPNTITAETCLAMNRAYQEVLLDTLRQLEMALNENRVKQKQLQESLEEKVTKADRPNKDFRIRDLNAPYFMDAKGNCPPKNEDVKHKELMNEYKQDIKAKPRWTLVQRNTLKHAVKVYALEQILKPVMNKLEVEKNKAHTCKTAEEIEENKARIERLQKEILVKQETSSSTLLQGLDVEKIDFMKISVVHFKGKFDASECKSMWKNALRPEINRDKWTKEEETKLEELVQKYNMKNWKDIAEELGTGRTPFQCLQHYQQNSTLFNTCAWTAEEDELLSEVVETCKYGSGKVPWHQVSYYIDRRSARQCRARWTEINPELKKGKWTSHEDCKLITAVHMLGASSGWQKIAQYIPGRSANQCRERYTSCLDETLNNNSWTYEEDKELLKLGAQCNNNWHKVASSMNRRSESILLARYNQLMKWKDVCEEFFKQPPDIQESLIFDSFTVVDGCQIMPKMVKAEPHKAKKQVVRRNKRRLSNIKEKEDCSEDENGSPANSKNDESDDDWLPKNEKEQDLEAKTFISVNAMQIEDYLKQLRDRQNNDIVVPRPPPLKSYKCRSYRSTWQRRKSLIKLVQVKIDQYVQNKDSIKAGSKNVIDHVSKSIEVLLGKNEQEKINTINSAFGDKQPSELTVRELLNISRGIKEVNKPRNSRKRKMEWEESSSESESELVCSDEEEDKEEVEEDTDEDIDEQEVETKPKRPKTQAELARIEKVRLKMKQHKIANESLRRIVLTKMSAREFSNKQIGRKKQLTIYPKYVLTKSRFATKDEIEKMRRKSFLLLLKSFDVDGHHTFRKAKDGKRKFSAMAILKSARKLKAAKTRRQYAFAESEGTMSHLDTEMNEIADNVLELQEELGIENDDGGGNEEVDNENDMEGSNNRITDAQLTAAPEFGTSTNNAASVEDQTGEINAGLPNSITTGKTEAIMANKVKSLPYIPPNLSTLCGMRKLLLEHRCLIDKSGLYFDPEDLRTQLYELKKRGPNPLMHVMNTVRKTDLKYEMPKCSDKIQLGDTANEQQEGMGLVAARKKRGLECQQTLREIRKTEPYQKLMARFQSIFTWPALLATIQPPKNASLPKALQQRLNAEASIRNSVDKESVNNNRTQSILTQTQHSGITMTTLSNNSIGSQIDICNSQNDNCMQQSDNNVVKEEFEGSIPEEEAVERLIAKIMEEYRLERERKKKRAAPVFKGNKKNKVTQKSIDARYERERTKILKRLGLTEKMRDYENRRRAKIQQSQGPFSNPGTSSQSVSEINNGLSNPRTLSPSVLEINDGSGSNPAKSPNDAQIEVALDDMVSESDRKDMASVSQMSIGSVENTSNLNLVPKSEECLAGIPDATADQEMSNIEWKENGDNRENSENNTNTMMDVMVCQNEIDKSQEPQAKRKKGRPFGSKTKIIVPPKELLKKSSRSAKNNRIVDLIQERPNRKRNIVEVKNAKLKNLIPQKMGALVSHISELPILNEPQPTQVDKKHQCPM